MTLVIWLWKAENKGCRQELQGHTGEVSDVKFSDDDKFLASASWDQTIKIWLVATETNMVIQSIDCGEIIRSLAFVSIDCFAAGLQSDTVKLFSSNGTISKTCSGHTNTVDGMAYSADGKWLASASSDKCLVIWDIKTGQAHKKFHIGSIWPKSLSFSPDSKRILSSSDDYGLRNQDLETGNSIDGLKDVPSAAAFSPNCDILHFTRIRIQLTFGP